MEVGALFDSWDEFAAVLKQFCDEEKVQLNIFSSKKVEAGNRRLAPNSIPHPARHKYKYARLACIHYGKRRSRSTGARANQSTFRSECPYTVFVSSDRALGKLKVAEACMVHNHDVGDDIYKMYPAQRRLTKEEEINAQSLIDLKVSKATLREHLQRVTGKQLTMKDVHNLKARFLANERDSTTLFFKAIEEIKVTDPGAVLSITPKEDGTLDAICLQTSIMAENFNRYPEVLLCDSKYSANSMNMPLFRMAVRDANGLSQAAAFVMIPERNSALLVDALAVFVASNAESSQIRFMMIDQDPSEIQVIQELLPHVKIHLSPAHVLKSIRQQAIRKVPEEHRTAVDQAVSGMVSAASEAIYDLFYTEMKAKSGYHFMTFFDSHWHACRETWSKFFMDPCTTCVKIENHGERLTKILSGKFAIHEVLKELVQYSKAKQDVKAVSVFNQTMKKKVGVPNVDETSFVENISPDATLSPLLPAVVKRVAYHISQNKDGSYCIREEGQAQCLVNASLTECSCNFEDAAKAFCTHIIALRKHKNLPVTDKGHVNEIGETSTPPHHLLNRQHTPTSAAVDSPKPAPSITTCTTDSTTVAPVIARYQTCLKLGMEMAELASANSSGFEEKMAILKHVMAAWKEGKSVSALVMDNWAMDSNSSLTGTRRTCLVENSDANTHQAAIPHAQPLAFRTSLQTPSPSSVSSSVTPKRIRSSLLLPKPAFTKSDSVQTQIQSGDEVVAFDKRKITVPPFDPRSPKRMKVANV